MIIWMDLETTGLDPKADVILEAAVVITDDTLAEVARGSWVTSAARSRDLHNLRGRLWVTFVAVRPWDVPTPPRRSPRTSRAPSVAPRPHRA